MEWRGGDRVMGCRRGVGWIGLQRGRFRVAGVDMRQLDVPRAALTKAPALVRPVLAAAGFAEAGANFKSARETKMPRKSAPVLQLVVSND